MSGYYGDVFTKKLAEEWLMLARKGEWALEDAGLSTEDFHVMEDEAAEIISKFEGDLSLDALNELSDAAAESLSKHKGDLYLYGLKDLSDAAAESLSKHEGELSLHGLTELSDAAAKSLVKKQPKFGRWKINLDNLPASAAQILRDAGHGE